MLGALLVILYLLIPHKNRPWVRHARFAVFAVNLAASVQLVVQVRAKNFAAAFGVGLMSVWGVIVCKLRGEKGWGS
jgi:hypothetical protein